MPFLRLYMLVIIVVKGFRVTAVQLYFQLIGTALELLIDMGEVFFLDIDFTVNGPPRVVEGVTEKPFIGLGRIEITG